MKPSLPKGTRDLGPDQVDRRQYIFTVIREAFVRRGYRPLETPAMENLATLTGKYGEEGDQLLFKILNNGDFLAKADAQALEERDSRKALPSISKRGLRYDLTVPFARYVTMNRHELAFPFKRYQIQPVWRADRPQKGRYQEFFQCDADVIGSDSLVYEAELIRIYDEVFHLLGIPVEIRLNNRKLLGGLARICGLSDRFLQVTAAIDKADKIGWEGVREEMLRLDLPLQGVDRIIRFLSSSDVDAWKEELRRDEEGALGLAEMHAIHAYLEGQPLHNPLVTDLTLARGLTYYTGAILEVKALGVEMGSIGGGGRYADLTGLFGLPGMSGVGISFGADRIYDVMDTLGLFPDSALHRLQVLVMALDASDHVYAYRLTERLRSAGLVADLYPEAAKLQKMMKYANACGAAHALLIGEEERRTGRFTLKDMVSGTQQSLDLEGIIQTLSSR